MYSSRYLSYTKSWCTYLTFFIQQILIGINHGRGTVPGIGKQTPVLFCGNLHKEKKVAKESSCDLQCHGLLRTENAPLGFTSRGLGSGEWGVGCYNPDLLDSPEYEWGNVDSSVDKNQRDGLLCSGGRELPWFKLSSSGTWLAYLGPITSLCDSFQLNMKWRQ